MSKIVVIKTLSHLNDLFLGRFGTTIYSTFPLESNIKTLESAYKLNLSELKFSKLVQTLSEIKQLKVDINESEESGEYKRVERVENILEFTIKGDVISIWLLGYDDPIRIEFFGEDCETIVQYDVLTGKQLTKLDSIILTRSLPNDKSDIFIKLNDNTELTKAILTNKSIKGIDRYFDQSQFEIIETDFTFPPLFFSKLDLLEREIERLESLGYEVKIMSKHKVELGGLKRYVGNLTASWRGWQKLSSNIPSPGGEGGERSEPGEVIEFSSLSAGLISESLKLAIFTDREIFGSIYLNKVKAEKANLTNFQKLLRQFEGELKIDDYVVHEDYGIAKYKGLQQETVSETDATFILLEYAADDKLFVPLTQINKVTKYLASEGHEPKLTRLGGGSWQNLKKKIKAATYLNAKELVSHYAQIEVSKAPKVLVIETPEYLKFAEDFEYNETKDQVRAIKEVLEDLHKEKPMSRLLVGDVGFGKTEVIMRATFKIIENGGQVAILSPTTVLTAQHYKTFTKRFKNVELDNKKVHVEQVSRFNSSSKNSEIIQKVNSGKVDIIIGTHRLLSNDVQFKNLQLVVVDEEQKFGVKQKEKIKKLNYGAHVLSVSATPIPRTLNLALSSIQEISIITTPPIGRKSINTEIIYNDWEKAAELIQKEVQRGGQVYFVHNRVQTINQIKTKLQELTPGIKYVVAHGQMHADDLDKVTSDFYLQKHDCLICTSIIENGLDLPNVNTIIIHDAHQFGLSQLYQLRGRVGRSEKQAFCYLMTPTKSTKQKAQSKKQESIEKVYVDRLQTLVENQDLGAGFRIASRDLELRGAGNILGKEQHGHINHVGYALYIQLLAEAVEKLRNEN